MLSDADRYELKENGFTEAELFELDIARTPDGSPQEVNIGHPSWGEAKALHFSIMVDYEKAHPGSTRADYERFLNSWFEGVVGGYDPWIWIDSNYFRTHRGVSKARWDMARRKVDGLQNQLQSDIVDRENKRFMD